MLRFQGDGSHERGAPGVERLSGDVGEQVQADRLETRLARRCHRRHHIRWPMTPAETPELTVVERLGPDREAVHARCPEPGEVADLVRTGVGLKGDLGVIGQPQSVGHSVEQRADLLHGHQRWRAAAEVHAAQRSARRRPRGGPQLKLGMDRTQHGLDATVRAPSRAPGHDHEIAVRTQREAEREVEVEAFRRERLRHGANGAVPASRCARCVGR